MRVFLMCNSEKCQGKNREWEVLSEDGVVMSIRCKTCGHESTAFSARTILFLAEQGGGNDDDRQDD